MKTHFTLMKSFIVVGLLACVTIGAHAQSGPFMFVFLNTNPDRPELPKETVDSLQALHIANIQRLSTEGKLIITGPFDSGGGIFVLATDSKETAQKWLSSDPAIRSQRWIIETIPYIPRIGSICKVIVQYEMDTHTLIRFKWGNGDPEKQLIQLVLPDSIVAAGKLEGSGSLIVVRGTINEDQIKKSKIVRDAKIEVTTKRLWIARGSFCEK